MTEEELEKSARKLCEIRGLDPDEKIGHGHPEGYAVTIYTKRWKFALEEIKSTLQILKAINL